MAQKVRSARRLVSAIQAVAGMGRHGDTMLAHINPAEAARLKAAGGAGTINPRTGLREFYTEGTGGTRGPGARNGNGPVGGGARAGNRTRGKGTDAEDRALADQLDKAAASGNRRPDSAPADTILDKIQGITSLGQRRARYANNPVVKNKGSVRVPNIPNPSTGQLTNMLGALVGGPASVAGTIVGGVSSGLGSDVGPYNSAQAVIDKALGQTPGKIEGSVAAGRRNDQAESGGRDQQEERRKRRLAAQQTALGSVNESLLGPGVLSI